MLDSYIRDFSDFLDLFVDQGSDGTLVVTCKDMASGLVAAAIDNFDQRRKLDAGISVTAPVDDVAVYTETLIAELQTSLLSPDQDSGANATPNPQTSEVDATSPRQYLATKEPPKAAPQTPAGRLLELFQELLEHLPDGDSRLLFALAPAQINDHQGYQKLVLELLQSPLPRLRLVLRDERPAAHIPDDFADTFRAHPGVHLFDLPIDFETLLHAAQTAANDPTRSRAERLSALLQLGFYELGHGSANEANGHFCQALAEISQAPKGESIDPSMLSLALFGHGEALRIDGASPEASETLALAWGSAESCPPVIKVSIALSLGRSLVAEEKLRRAQVFLSLACAFAAHCDIAELATITLIELGDVEAALGDHEAARAAWSTAREHTVSESTEVARDLDRRIQASPCA